ncbi:MAG: hypothetical protein CMM00_09240 [Rhodopirellula sp.]|nr:hypothetical protein [Rhodopirellula sp.]
MDCKVQVVQCKLQSVLVRHDCNGRQLPICNVHLAICKRGVGHVSHGGHADALGQSESTLRVFLREQDRSAEDDRQAGPGLRGGMDCKVQIVQCKLQSGFGLT